MVGYEMLAETQRDLTAERQQSVCAQSAISIFANPECKNESERKNTISVCQRIWLPCHHTIQAPGRVNLIGEHTDYNAVSFCPARLIIKP